MKPFFFVTWPAEVGGVQRHHSDAAPVRLIDRQLQHPGRKILSAKAGLHMKVEQEGAHGLGIHPVWRKVYKPQVLTPDDCVCVDDQPPNVGVCLELRPNPRYGALAERGDA